MSRLNTFFELMRNKKVLLKCIFFTLLTQVAITIGFIKMFDKIEITNNILNLYNSSTAFSIFIFILFGISIFLIYLMIRTPLTYWQKYMIFILFSLIQGVFLHIILSNYNEKTITFAFYSTIVIFISLFLFGLFIVYLGYDLSWLGFILFISLFTLIITQLVFMFIGNYDTHQKIFAIISLVIFILYVIYDTNIILLKYKNTTDFCITGSLDYYLDVINIFVDLLKLSDR